MMVTTVWNPSFAPSTKVLNRGTLLRMPAMRKRRMVLKRSTLLNTEL